MIYAIGAFDGFHIGHQQLLEAAKEISFDWGVITFEQNPQQYFVKEKFKSLFTAEERKLISEYFDIPKVLALPFTKELAELSPENFLEKISKYELSGIVIGENFRFGKNRTGTPQFLRDYCETRKFDFREIKSLMYGEKAISSTLIRRMVQNGNMRDAEKLLNYPYFVSGKVIRGDRRGCSIGFPTANIHFSEEKIQPKTGSYFAVAIVKGNIYEAVVNVGYDPTFIQTKELRCETHILNFKENIYGEEIRIFFLERNRDEKKFEDKESLISQLRTDIANAEKISGKYIKNNKKMLEKFARLSNSDNK